MTESTPPLDDAQLAFVETFRRFLATIDRVGNRAADEPTAIGRVVQEHLGADPRHVPQVLEAMAAHRLLDADIAMRALAAEDPAASLVGVSGGQQRDHQSFSELMSRTFMDYAPGPVDYANLPCGPREERQIVAFGLYLLTYEGEPLAVLQRGPRPDHGRSSPQFEVLCRAPDVVPRFLRRLRDLMLELSVLRGQVISLSSNAYEPGAGGVTFHERPDVGETDVILPDGVLSTIVGHVEGIAQARERLLAFGQHLKRGVLLYGPPGTGKTLTVRHLLARTPGTTAVLLAGETLRYVTDAAHIARAMQPAIVVLEDCDLIAEDRDGYHGSQPLLFQVLEALDGLDGDADVAFVLTTNRADLLERALVERPGRVDLAVEIPLPDQAARRRLFRLYARSTGLSGTALDAAADRAAGTTASFAKELVRRAVLRAASEDRGPRDDDLVQALDGLLSDRESLTRSLLGAADAGRPRREPQ